MNRVSGKWKNNLSGEMAYRSFVPVPLPPKPEIEYDAEFLNLIIQANVCVKYLDSGIAGIPDINLFIAMYVRKEALMSSQIEGTQATLDDIFDPDSEENANKNVADVINYIKAVNFAIDRLKNLPLCNRLIKETHAVLMENVRGQEKYPGEFRRSQNWIGGNGSTLKTARYIPPEPNDMEKAMADFEVFINADDGQDILVKAALIHYQFETIHPFLDGNGRLGRLFVILFLIDKGLLSAPALYISYFLKANRTEYYDRMTKIRETGDFEQWVKFFLIAITKAAEDAVSAIKKMTALHNKNLEIIGKMGRTAKTCLKLYVYIEENPLITAQKTADALGLSFNTAADAIKRLCGEGILIQTENKRRNRIFAYEAYLEILREGTENI